MNWIVYIWEFWREGSGIHIVLSTIVLGLLEF